MQISLMHLMLCFYIHAPFFSFDVQNELLEFFCRRTTRMIKDILNCMPMKMKVTHAIQKPVNQPVPSSPPSGTTAPAPKEEGQPASSATAVYSSFSFQTMILPIFRFLLGKEFRLRFVVHDSVAEHKSYQVLEEYGLKRCNLPTILGGYYDHHPKQQPQQQTQRRQTTADVVCNRSFRQQQNNNATVSNQAQHASSSSRMPRLMIAAGSSSRLERRFSSSSSKSFPPTTATGLNNAHSSSSSAKSFISLPYQGSINSSSGHKSGRNSTSILLSSSSSTTTLEPEQLPFQQQSINHHSSSFHLEL